MYKTNKVAIGCTQRSGLDKPWSHNSTILIFETSFDRICFLRLSNSSEFDKLLQATDEMESQKEREQSK